MLPISILKTRNEKKAADKEVSSYFQDAEEGSRALEEFKNYGADKMLPLCG
jgi:hypothetical protein